MGWTRRFHTISSHWAPPPSSLPLPPPVRYRCTLGKNGMKSTRRGHSLVRSLVRSHCSLICLLRTARFAPALRCARSLARLLTCWFACLPTRSRVLGRVFFLWNERVDFMQFYPSVHRWHRHRHYYRQTTTLALWVEMAWNWRVECWACPLVCSHCSIIW